ncbi:hypothetical protein ACI78V_02160 [Geodermatophilus sp. SYSU D00742]
MPTCRDEILAALPPLARKSRDGTFTADEVVAALSSTGTRYSESTIRTHVTSRMCANAPDHHARTFDDLERVDRGRYRLRRPQH